MQPSIQTDLSALVQDTISIWINYIKSIFAELEHFI